MHTLPTSGPVGIAEIINALLENGKLYGEQCDKHKSLSDATRLLTK